VVVSFYLALMTAECLSLTGAEGPTVVEGPFAGNRLYLEMLASATHRPVEAVQRGATGTSIGAALLARMEAGPPVKPPVTVAGNDDMAWYAGRWREMATI
jgi:sugar (pentulose or hexulose) kinase